MEWKPEKKSILLKFNTFSKPTCRFISEFTYERPDGVFVFVNGEKYTVLEQEFMDLQYH